MTAPPELPFVRFGPESTPAQIAAALRTAGRTPREVQTTVADLIHQVEEGGDAALL